MTRYDKIDLIFGWFVEIWKVTAVDDVTPIGVRQVRGCVASSGRGGHAGDVNWSRWLTSSSTTLE